MIFYFSGTGNSEWVARKLGELLQEPVSRMTAGTDSENDYVYTAQTNENIVLVFPVHSWGPPVLVDRFVKKLSLLNTKDIFAVACCGDECGMTDRILAKELTRKGLTLKGCYSVEMPNNYVLMKGFDVDPETVATRKLEEAPVRATQIAEAIRQGRPDAALYHAGPWKWMKSRIVYPAFIHFVVGKSKFVVKDNCIGCKICSKVCPTHNITMKDKRPCWGNDCIQCTACIHLCPVKAIEYGKISVDKGRYHHPDFKLNDQP